MSGLCAVVVPPSFSLESTLETMLGRMAHYPWLQPVRDGDQPGHVAWGAVTFEGRGASTLATSRDGLAIVLLGELFDAERERERLTALGAAVEGHSDTSLVLAGWRHEGAAFLARLNGEFAAAIWDRTKRELHVITDRFGLRPLYVAQSGGGFVAASEVKSVLVLPGVDTSWSEQGVTQFFGFGHFFQGDTLLRGVRAVPPATVGTYRAAEGTYQEAKYWTPRLASATSSPAEMAGALEDRFVAAVERRARAGERLGLSLSGGLDARTILGVMPRGLDLQTVSLGIEGSLDHKSASELAAIAGVPHHQFVLDANFLSAFEAHLRQMVRLTDGHYLDQGIVMPTMTMYRDLGIEYLMRGHGGELLHMTKAYAFSLDGSALTASEAGLEAWLLSHLTGYMLDGVPADLFTIDLRAGTQAVLRRALGRSEPVDRPIDRVWQLFLNERIHRETTLSMHLFGCFASIRQPYLDNDVVDALLSMPASMKLGDQLQTEILRHRQPPFLAVTNANTGARLGAGRIANELARWRLRIGAKLGWKGYQPYERLGLWLKRELRSFVESTLTSPLLLDTGLVRPDAVKRVMNEHLASQANHTFLLMSLIIFALGQEMRNPSRAL